MNFLATLCISILVVHSSAFASQETATVEILASVKSRGARVVVEEIWASEVKTKQLLSGVASAAPNWIEVAKALKPGTDAGASEELNDAISLALLKDPYLLLPWLQQVWWNGNANEVCVFGYDSELPGGVSPYVSKLQRALAKEPPRELRPLRDQCRQGIKQTRMQVLRAPK